MNSLVSAFVLFLIFSDALCSISASGCGKRPLVDNYKIVNGNKSIVGDWAWTVSLTNGENGRHFCGGVLINAEYVLSAAHCFQNSAVNPNHRVYIGVHNRQQNEEWVYARSISKLFRHESFNGVSLTNDISLIKLNQPVVFDDKYIIPVCIEESNVDAFEPEGKQGWLTGWGHQFYQSGVLMNEKYLGALDILTKTRCKQRYGNSINPDFQICGGENNANAGACQGDSGGPLVMQDPRDGKWYLQGVVSWGFGCGQGTVFTRVKSYLNWINQRLD